MLQTRSADTLGLAASILRRVAFQTIPLAKEPEAGQTGHWEDGYAPEAQRDALLTPKTGWESKPSSYRVHSTVYGDVSINQSLGHHTLPRRFHKERTESDLENLMLMVELTRSVTGAERDAYVMMIKSDFPDADFNLLTGEAHFVDVPKVGGRSVQLIQTLGREEKTENVSIKGRSKNGETVTIESSRSDEFRKVSIQRELKGAGPDGTMIALRIEQTQKGVAFYRAEQKGNGPTQLHDLDVDEAIRLVKAAPPFEVDPATLGGRALQTILDLQRSSFARASLAPIFLALLGATPPAVAPQLPVPILADDPDQRVADVARTAGAQAMYWHLDTLHTADYQLTGSDFARWIRGETEKLPAQPTMNCWEGALVLAHKANVLPKEKIVEIFGSAAESARAAAAAVGPGEDTETLTKKYVAAERGYLGTLMTGLGWDKRRPLGEGEPKPGNFVFFSMPEEAGNPTPVRHVAIYLGKNKRGQHQIVGLYGKGLERSTVEATVKGDFRGAEVWYAAGPWGGAR